VSETKLFGTSGIRGVANVEMTPEMATKLGAAFASLLNNEGVVAVGRDVRLPAEAFQHALVSGLLAGGVNVEDYGPAPTPALLWAVKKRKLDGAAVVTGSHTPPEIIGFLFFMSDTAELSYEESRRFEKIVSDGPRLLSWNEVGKRTESELFDIYLESVLEQADLRRVSSGFKVAVDPGNGVAALTLDKILKAAQVETVTINGEVDGTFPSRDPYPRPEVLGDLMRTVKENKADLGIATDEDGDRAIFVDEKGGAMWGDISGSVFVEETLREHGGGVAVAPINSTQLLKWVCDRFGGRIVYSRVGPPAIVSEMKRVKAVFGLEETGKYVWPKSLLYGDSALATLKMLEIISKRQKTLSQLVQEFPKFYSIKKAFHCPDRLKQKVLTKSLEQWRKREEKAEVVDIDGLKFIYPDGSWMLLRPSGTEPVFRVYVESESSDQANQLAKLASSLVKKTLR